jgi:glycosyltransferase involved in cell wall biosynthesis
MRILHFTPYVPRECGIATYLQDLKTALDLHLNSDVMVVDDSMNKIIYRGDIAGVLRSDQINEYKHFASFVNNANYDIVHIQHEFGLFGGDDGCYLLEALSELKKPFVITFHTVLSKPNNNQLGIVKNLAQKAAMIVVMADIAKERLVKKYLISESKIAVIPHGVPDFFLSKNLGEIVSEYEGRKIISTFGLLGRNKGIEYILKAMPEIARHIPDVLFLSVGKTHPVVLRQEGEQYRNTLLKIIDDLGIGKYCQFINKYLALDQVKYYLSISDIYITPYLEPEQITSGTLAYALGAGKACISTGYPYAVEVLKKGGGIIVPFKDEKAIAKAATKILSDNNYKTKLSEKSYQVGKKMRWQNVAKEHIKLFNSILR